jgi:hypothetical protein
MTTDQLDEVPKKTSPMIELGVTGLKRAAGTVDEEFLVQLRGRQGIQVFREMQENSPIVGAMTYAMDRLLRQVEWKVVPPTDKAQSREGVEFVEECRDDMSHTWDEHISEALTSLWYGWAYHEIVFKRRLGQDQKDGSSRSRYDDGKIGIRKMPLRAQETLLRWVFDDTGGIKAMVQMAPPKYDMVTIPIEKALLYRPRAYKNNPEGFSLLRNAYRPWYFMKRLEEHELVGVERDLAGMPVVRLPREVLAADPNSDDGKLVASMRKMVQNVRRNEQDGVLFPTEIDEETKQDRYSFELMGGGGTRQFTTDQIIRRYSEQILMSMLSDFMMLGSNSSGGSYAMHTDKTGMFRAAINSVTQSIADTQNRHLLPRLWKLNGFDPETMPHFEPTNIDPPNLGELAQLVSSMTGAGMTFFPDGDLEDFVRQAARLPMLDDKEKRGRDLEQAQSDLLRIAQQRSEILTVHQQSSQQAQALQNPQMQMDPNADPANPQMPPPPQMNLDGVQPPQQTPEQPAPAPQMNLAGVQPPQQPAPAAAPRPAAPKPPQVPGQDVPQTQPRQPVGKRLDPAHGERLNQIVDSDVTNGVIDMGERYPAGTPGGMIGRVAAKARDQRMKYNAKAKKPQELRIFRKQTPPGGPQ